MHKAHELLEALRPDSEDYALVMRAIKFDLGDYETASATAELSTDTFWKAPFPVCVFQWAEGQRTHLFLTIQDEDQLTVRGFYKNEGTGFRWDNYSFDFVAKTSNTESGGTEMAFMSHKGEDITDWVFEQEHGADCGSMLVDTARCMEVFSCSNVVQIEHAAPKFINKKRQQKRKPPVFAFRTLPLTCEHEEKQGGTSGTGRAGPRLHLRRGHIRRLANGRRVWVRSAIVGDKSIGFVHKDYRVTPSHNSGLSVSVSQVFEPCR